MSKTNIWQQLKRPIMVQAPMADVTDAAFRQIINKYGKPDLFFTEFVSADGLMHPEGRKKLLRELYFVPSEKPIIAQLFTSRPEVLKEAVAFVETLGFDGIDINMGCPDRGIEKQGCGADLIKHPKLAQELILAAKAGTSLPVSVKTRIGYNKNEIKEWAETLLETEPTAITFHLRTRKEMSKVEAHWDEIKIPVELARGSKTLILGNGDVSDLIEAKNKVDLYGVDGVMIGRGIYGNPWLYSGVVPSVAEKLKVLIEHSNLFWDLFGLTEKNKELFGGHTKSFAIMKKHFKAYVEGFAGASELRAELMQAENAEAVEEIINRFLAEAKFLV